MDTLYSIVTIHVNTVDLPVLDKTWKYEWYMGREKGKMLVYTSHGVRSRGTARLATKAVVIERRSAK